jgi:hypothetical protein
MSITTYTELKAAITSWGKRSDLSSMADDFIDLAEAKLNRRLRCWQQETALVSTPIVSGAITRPSDLLAFKTLVNVNNTGKPVEQKSLEYVLSHPSDGPLAQYYAWDGSNLRFNSQGGTVQGVYYAAIPALSSSAETNWLLTLAPDLYLDACLSECYYFQFDETRGAFYEGRRDNLVEELNIQDKNNRFSGNSLVMRTA